MKILMLFGLCLIVSGCGDGGHYTRSYVISQSQTAPDADMETPENSGSFD